MEAWLSERTSQLRNRTLTREAELCCADVVFSYRAHLGPLRAKLFLIETVETHFAKKRSHTNAGISRGLIDAAVKRFELFH